LGQQQRPKTATQQHRQHQADAQDLALAALKDTVPNGPDERIGQRIQSPGEQKNETHLRHGQAQDLHIVVRQINIQGQRQKRQGQTHEAQQ
jgi:hypothetical protein